jgi:hypothetical protein
MTRNLLSNVVAELRNCRTGELGFTLLSSVALFLEKVTHFMYLLASLSTTTASFAIEISLAQVHELTQSVARGRSAFKR